MEPTQERQTARAIYHGLTKGRSPATEQRPLPWRLAELERSAGGPGAAARQVGVSDRTWRRWKSGGGQPAPNNQRELGRALRRARLRPGRERRLIGRKPKIIFRGTVRFSADVRERDIDLSPFVDDAFMRDLTAAYLRGDDRGMVEIFEERGLGSYLAGLEIIHVDSISFGL